MSTETAPAPIQDPAQLEAQAALAPVDPEQALVGATAGEYIGRHRATGQEESPMNPDRFASRVGVRIADLAERLSNKAQGFAEGAAERRTVGQTVGEKVGLGRKIAGRFGRRIVSEAKRTGMDIADNAREDFASVTESVKSGVESVRGKWQQRAEAAKEHKAARVQERQERRENRKMLKEAYAENNSRDDEKRLAYLNMRDEATAENKAFDKAARERRDYEKLWENLLNKQDKQSEKQASREERARKVTAAKVAGKAMLKGAGLTVVVPAVVTGMGVSKVAKGTARLSREAAYAVSDRAAEAKENYHANRAASLEEKADKKAATLRAKAAEHASKVTTK